jgi:hypothetical protein
MQVNNYFEGKLYWRNSLRDVFDFERENDERVLFFINHIIGLLNTAIGEVDLYLSSKEFTDILKVVSFVKTKSVVKVYAPEASRVLTQRKWTTNSSVILSREEFYSQAKRKTEKPRTLLALITPESNDFFQSFNQINKSLLNYYVYIISQSVEDLVRVEQTIDSEAGLMIKHGDLSASLLRL